MKHTNTGINISVPKPITRSLGIDRIIMGIVLITVLSYGLMFAGSDLPNWKHNLNYNNPDPDISGSIGSTGSIGNIDNINSIYSDDKITSYAVSGMGRITGMVSAEEILQNTIDGLPEKYKTQHDEAKGSIDEKIGKLNNNKKLPKGMTFKDYQPQPTKKKDKNGNIIYNSAAVGFSSGENGEKTIGTVSIPHGDDRTIISFDKVNGVSKTLKVFYESPGGIEGRSGLSSIKDGKLFVLDKNGKQKQVSLTELKNMGIHPDVLINTLRGGKLLDDKIGSDSHKALTALNNGRELESVRLAKQKMWNSIVANARSKLSSILNAYLDDWLGEFTHGIPAAMCGDSLYKKEPDPDAEEKKIGGITVPSSTFESEMKREILEGIKTVIVVCHLIVAELSVIPTTSIKDMFTGTAVVDAETACDAADSVDPESRAVTCTE